MNYLLDLLNINNNSAENENFDRKTFGIIIVKENICAIDKARWWDILFLKETLKTQEKCLALINGFKVSKELKLF